MRRADRGRFEYPVLHDPSAEKFFDDVQDVPIRHFRAQACHDDRMGDVIEEPANVGIENSFIALAPESQHPFHGLVAVSPRTESVGILMKQRLEDLC